MGTINKDRNFLLYLFGSNTSVFGDVLLSTALAIYVMKTTNSPQAFGGILSLAYVPKLVLSLFSGAIVDRLNSKWVMVLLDLLRGSILMIYFVFHLLSLNAIIALILIFAICDSFFLPASVSIVPGLFRKSEIGTVNSVDQSIRSTLNVVSPLIASFLFMVGNIEIILLIDAITFILSGLSELLFRYCEIKERKPYTLLGDVVDGAKVIFKDIRVRSLIINGALTHLFLFSFIEVGMISLLLVVFKAPAYHYGILQGVISFSTILASLLALWQKSRQSVSTHINLGILGMLIAVLFFLPLSFSGFLSYLTNFVYMPLIFLSIGCFAMFLSFGYYVVFFRTFYQSHVQQSYLGRFSAMFLVLVSLSKLLGLSLYGFLFSQDQLIIPVAVLSVGMVLKLLVHIPFINEERKIQNQSLEFK